MSETLTGDEMVLPVNGPTVQSETFPFGQLTKQGYTQAMPVDRPLPYVMIYSYGREDYTFDVFPYSQTIKRNNFNFRSMSGYSRARTAAYNQAYEQMRSKLGPQSGWAENIAQMTKTRKMVVDRSLQLASFVTALRRGRFGDAARALRTPIPSGVSHRKAVSQNFLEWEYGAKPLISDLQSGMQTLTSHPGDITYISGRGSGRISELLVTRVQGPPSWISQVETWVGNLDVTCRSGIRVTNPNVFLANQLGLIDLALPWKLIPFSFVVDWFINVEQVISSMTDWYGLQLINPHYTEYSKGSYLQVYSTYGIDPATGLQINSGTRRFEKDSVRLDRVMGLPGPTLQIKPFKGFSLNRGAQALALVAAVLGK